MYYSPVTFRQAGLSTNQQLLGATLIVGFVKVFFVCVAVVLLDQYGRRPLLLTSVGGEPQQCAVGCCARGLPQASFAVAAMPLRDYCGCQTLLCATYTCNGYCTTSIVNYS